MSAFVDRKCNLLQHKFKKFNLKNEKTHNISFWGAIRKT